MITSYITVKDKIESFCNQHLQVKKFGGEFADGIGIFATKDEKYPIVYLTPISQTLGQNTSVFEIDLYCLDIIEEDRTNINTILSDTNLILNDFWIYVRDGQDYSIDILGTPGLTPINNALLDYAAGWVGRFQIEVDNYCITELPLSGNI